MLVFERRGQENTDADISLLARELNVPEICARVLAMRGYTDAEDARRFLSPSLDDLADPFLLSDMDKAVKRIIAARAKNERVTVFGDYDADGVCSAAICMKALGYMGIKADFYIPSRFEEGYGLNENSMRQIAESGTDLLITVDCGINAFPEIKLANELGIDVIITDHHECPPELPEAEAVINPHRTDSEYPFRDLCGAGTALRLAMSLGCPPEGLLQLAAIATVADIVPLTGENRVIVSLGLQEINSSPLPGVRALIHAASVREGAVTAGRLGFAIAPRLNAGGRVSSADKCVRLMLEENPTEAEAAAMLLNGENNLRKKLETHVVDSAEEKLSAAPADKKIIILDDENWSEGVIGIAASRLVEKYYRPVVLFAHKEGKYTGSARSVPGINIYDLLSSAKEHYIRFGGHAGAAGLTVSDEEFAAFRGIVEGRAAEYPDDLFIKRIPYDLELSLSDADISLTDALSMLEPFGYGNPEPVFLFSDVYLRAVPLGRNGEHSKLVAEGPNAPECLAFGMNPKDFDEGRYDILAVLDANEWQGVSRAQLILRSFIKTEDRDHAKGGADADECVKALYRDMLRGGISPSECRQVSPESIAQRISPEKLVFFCFTEKGAAEARAFMESLGIEYKETSGSDIPEGCAALCFPSSAAAYAALSRRYAVLWDSPFLPYAENPLAVPFGTGKDYISSLSRGIIASRDDYAAVYRRMLSLGRFDADSLAAGEGAADSINAALAAAVFRELGLIEKDGGMYAAVQGAPKKNLADSPTYGRINRYMSFLYKFGET